MSKIKLIRQTTITECGLCCLAMVSSFYGYKQSISFYRNLFSVGRDGTSVKELYDIFSVTGFDVEVYRCEKLNDFEFIKGIPYIIYCNNHYITIQVRNGKAIIFDPADKRKRIQLSDLDDVFSGIIIFAKPNDEFKKINNNIGEYRYVKSIVKDNMGLLFLTFFLSVLSYMMSIVVPILLQRFIDSDIYNLETKEIVYKILMLLAGYVFISLIRNRINVLLQTTMLDDINKKTVYHLFRIPYSFFDNRSSGNILYRLGVLSHIRDVISSSFIGIIMDLTCVICVYLYISFAFSYLIIPITLLMILIGSYIFLVAKKSVELQRNELQANESVNDLETEIVTNIYQIKCLHLEPFFWETFRTKFDISKGFLKKEKIFSADTSILYSAFSIFMPIFVILSCVNNRNIELTNGRILLVYTLIGMLMNYTFNFFSEIITVYEIKALVFYLNDLFDEPEEIPEGEKVLKQFNNLSMENVSFGYSKKNIIIKNFNMKVSSGQKIAIVGASGCGKTTLVKLIAGLYKPRKGCIKINGEELQNIKQECIDESVTIVPQQSIIFNKSIRDNITMEDASISDVEVYEALNNVCLLDDVINMPMTIDTFISGQGGNLSGGQLQRLALARAIVRRPKLLVLDEATSSLDAKTENMIYKNLNNMGLTSIIISHRLSTILDADCIYYLDSNGYCISGTHQKLIESSEEYCELFYHQFSQGKNENEKV